ncbi:site-specific integrase [Amycolatopsis alba]|uniref:Integrase n=1 Tax=Amycolatopsis alba DSM 44262 TaxID=1125972 RepID=A0A229S6K9_AMYAL|nr:tyrosine-type recombinase/integrase [Amycolatopsis alba]OXM54455.1 integrase [Amycolatopsis alba DSM 44262]
MTTNLTKQGLPRPKDDMWRSYIEEWDRSLRASNRPHTTRYNYQLAVTQLSDFLGGPELPDFLTRMDMPADDDSDAAQDPTDVSRKHVEWYIAWMIDTRSASTALNKYKGVQQFFNYLVEGEEMDRHPMDKLSQPDTPAKLIPVLSDDEIVSLLETCRGKTYSDRRDTAIIRLFLDTGARLSEIAGLQVDNLDLKRDGILVHGKGDRQRFVPFGERAGQAMSRYLRVRSRHPAADLPDLFLAERGRKAFKPNGIKIMLRRRGNAAGVSHMHAHRLRHTLSHVWQREQGNESDLMAIMGWRSPEMLRRYGASAAAERAENTHRTLNLGNRI